MATFYSDIQTTVNGPASGQPLGTRVKVNKLNGRVRYFEALFVAPASGAAPAIADKIVWGKLPVKSRILGHLSKMYWSAGGAGCTLTLGDNIVNARHLAATSIAALGNAIPEASALVNAATASTTVGSNQLTSLTSIGAFTIGAIVTGAGIQTGTTITGLQPSATVGAGQATMSAVATATATGAALTVIGGAYETQDDSNTVANAFSSTTDDATLISLIAGAQIANNQVIALKVAYVQD